MSELVFFLYTELEVSGERQRLPCSDGVLIQGFGRDIGDICDGISDHVLGHIEVDTPNSPYQLQEGHDWIPNDIIIHIMNS